MRLRSLLALILGLALATPLVFADEVLKPTKAQSAMRKAMRKVPSNQKADEAKRYSIEYLAAWKASGRTPTPTDKYALAQFRQSAGEPVQAAREFRAVQIDEGVKEKTQDYAASAEAALLLDPTVRGAFGKDELGRCAERLGKYADAMAANPGRAKNRTTLMKILARVHAAGGNTQAAHDLRMQIVKSDPKSLSALAGPIMQAILMSSHAKGGYDALRTKAAGVLKTLRDQQAAIVAEKTKKFDKSMAKLKASNPDALDADGKLKKTSSRGMSPDEKAVYTDTRSLATAQGVLDKLATHEKPLALLGKPAADWTTEKAFGDVASLADLKGKVTILDFWATWPDYNNLPVMRDLLKAYGEKGLSIVGLTTTASVVYATRYDADEDMRSKMEPGARLYYAARLASESAPADESKAIYDEKQYREIELQAIEEFAKNHELTWPLVMIAKDDPAAKYGQSTWPHLVVLDKEGTVRFLYAGMASRDKEAVVAKLKAVVEALLAE